MPHEMSNILAANGKEKRMIRTEELLARRIADHNRFVALKNKHSAIDVFDKNINQEITCNWRRRICARAGFVQANAELVQHISNGQVGGCVQVFEVGRRTKDFRKAQLHAEKIIINNV